MTKRTAAAAALLGVMGSACHRITGVDGYGAGFRHGHGYEAAAQVQLWAAFAAITVGLGWLAYAAWRRSHELPAAEYASWGGTLAIFGVVAWIVLAFGNLSLLLCHGTC